MINIKLLYLMKIVAKVDDVFAIIVLLCLVHQILL